MRFWSGVFFLVWHALKCGLSLSALRLLTMPRLLQWSMELSADIQKVFRLRFDLFVQMASNDFESVVFCLLSSVLRYYDDGCMAIFWKECDKHPALKLLDL